MGTNVDNAGRLSDADADTDSRPTGDRHANENADACPTGDGHCNADKNANACAASDSDTNKNANACAASDSKTNENADACATSDSNTNENADAHAAGDSYPDTSGVFNSKMECPIFDPDLLSRLVFRVYADIGSNDDQLFLFHIIQPSEWEMD